MSTRMKETALPLKEQLAGSRAGWYRRVRAERHAIIRRHRAPAIVRANAKGETLDVATLLKKGPVILTFYRGLYCNLELKAFCRKRRQRAHRLWRSAPRSPTTCCRRHRSGWRDHLRLTDVDYRDRADPSDVLKALIQRAATA